MQGIYRIDGPKGCVYIGSAKNIKRRWYEHKWRLKKNIHHSPKLQSAWNKYGESVFKFSVIEYVLSVDDLDRIEQIWLNILFTSLDNTEIYNGYRYSNSPRGIPKSDAFKLNQSQKMRGRRWTEEHKRKIGEAKLGRSRGISMSNHQALQRSGGKVYTIIDPNGNVYDNIINLAVFCREHQINRAGLREVLFKDKDNYKGWKGNLKEII